MRMQIRVRAERCLGRSGDGSMPIRCISVSSEAGVLRRAASTARLSHTDSVSNCRCAASFTRALVSGETRVLITSVTIVGHSVTQQAPAIYPAFLGFFSETQTRPLRASARPGPRTFEVGSRKRTPSSSTGDHSELDGLSCPRLATISP
jgi:hypothetical protein